MPKMIFARPDGQWFDLPGLEMAAMSGNHLQVPVKPDLIPLPEGATLTMMPEAAPIGFRPGGRGIPAGGREPL